MKSGDKFTKANGVEKDFRLAFKARKMNVSLNRRVYSHRQRRDYFLPGVTNAEKTFYVLFKLALGVRERYLRFSNGDKFKTKRKSLLRNGTSFSFEKRR